MAAFALISKLGLSGGTLTLLLTLVLFLTLTLYVYFAFYKQSDRVMELVNKIPGPKCYPIIGSAYVFGTDPKALLQSISEVIKEYGSVSRHWIGPFLYIVTQSPSDIEVFLTSSTLITKVNVMGMMKNGLGDGLIISTGDKWKKHRKLLQPAFHSRVLRDYLKVSNRQAKILNKQLESQVDKGDFDVVVFINNYVYDTILENLMGAKSSQQLQPNKPQVLSLLRQGTYILSYRFFKPWAYIDNIFFKTNYGKEYMSNMKIVHNVIKQFIHSKKETINTGKTQTPDEHNNMSGKFKVKSFLEYVLELGQANQLSDSDVFDEVTNMFIAGLDTSDASMGYLSLVLSRRFDLQEKILEEIQDVLGSLEEVPLTYESIKSLKYLDRFIKETLRVFSTVPYIGRQITEDTKLPSGYTVPAGCGMIIPIFVIHRHPEIYPNPNVFDPDNFLPERVAERHPFSFFPFSAGPRSCIGQKYAVMQLKVFLIYLLRRYWLTPSNLEIELTSAMSMIATNGINIGLKTRTPDRPIVPDYHNLSKCIRTNVDFLNVEFKDCYI